MTHRHRHRQLGYEAKHVRKVRKGVRYFRSGNWFTLSERDFERAYESKRPR